MYERGQIEIREMETNKTVFTKEIGKKNPSLALWSKASVLSLVCALEEGKGKVLTAIGIETGSSAFQDIEKATCIRTAAWHPRLSELLAIATSNNSM